MILKRLGLSMLIGIVVGAVLSEIAFYFQHETARPPQDITLTIPAGTAAEVARGVQPPSIPTNMDFVIGDTLIVNNQDSVEHKLGPLWIPAHSSAQMELGTTQNILFECSFQTTKVLGITVRKPLTWDIRIFGILFAGIPLGFLILVYSFVVPAKPHAHPA